MAVTWTIDLSNVDVDAARADVRATRVDTGPPETTHVFSFYQAIIATGPDRAALLSRIKALETAQTTDDATAATFIDGLEATAKAQLEAWEATR